LATTGNAKPISARSLRCFIGRTLRSGESNNHYKPVFFIPRVIRRLSVDNYVAISFRKGLEFSQDVIQITFRAEYAPFCPDLPQKNPTKERALGAKKPNQITTAAKPSTNSEHRTASGLTGVDHPAPAGHPSRGGEFATTASRRASLQWRGICNIERSGGLNYRKSADTPPEGGICNAKRIGSQNYGKSAGIPPVEGNF
jgi:hypothetical protein